MSGIVGKNLGRGSGVIAATPVGADAVSGSNLADDACDSEHYVNASIDEAHISDNAVSLAKMAGGTDGQIISYDASGDPVALGPGTDGQVLTSTGAGSPPAFEALPASAGEVFTGHYYTNPLNAPGAHSVTGVGFEPDSLFAMQIENRGKCGMSWGFATQSPSDNGSMTAYNVAANDTGDNQQRYDSQQSHIFWLWQDASNHVQATVTSWDADGFTFTITETGSLVVPAGGFMFMALKM